MGVGRPQIYGAAGDEKTESRRRCLQERARCGGWGRAPACPSPDWNATSPGSQTSAQNDPNGATSIHALQFSKYDRSQHGGTGGEGREQTTTREYCQTPWCDVVQRADGGKHQPHTCSGRKVVGGGVKVSRQAGWGPGLLALPSNLGT